MIGVVGGGGWWGGSGKGGCSGEACGGHDVVDVITRVG